MIKRVGVFLSILILWVFFSVSFIFASIFSPHLFKNDTSLLNTSLESKNIFATDSPISDGASTILAATQSGDARITLINRFLFKYRSPMQGTGKDFVLAADQNGLDWRLLPAIAFQESNLGKKIPKESYNPFGWAIYSGKNSGVRFTSWTEAINTVARGIKTRYIDKGYNSPETIVARYTSNESSPIWTFAVTSAMEEISQEEF